MFQRDSANSANLITDLKRCIRVTASLSTSICKLVLGGISAKPELYFGQLTNTRKQLEFRVSSVERLWVRIQVANAAKQHYDFGETTLNDSYRSVQL